jgi:hypothetical protein
MADIVQIGHSDKTHGMLQCSNAQNYQGVGVTGDLMNYGHLYPYWHYPVYTPTITQIGVYVNPPKGLLNEEARLARQKVRDCISIAIWEFIDEEQRKSIDCDEIASIVIDALVDRGYEVIKP